MGRPKGKPHTPEEEEALRQRRITNSKKWRTQNKEKSLEYGRRYNATRTTDVERNRQYQDRYRQKKRAKREASGWVRRVPMTPEERITQRRERERIRRAQHPEKTRANTARYRQRHPDRISILNAAHIATRRALLLKADGTFSAKDISALYVAQGARCANAACRKQISDKSKSPKKFHIDHVVPLTKGGSNYPDNLQLLCRSCNSRKHAKDPERWAAENGLLFS